MLGLFVSIAFITALAGHIATSIPTWKRADRLFAARATEAVGVNEPQLAMAFPCQAHPDWSKTTSIPSRMLLAVQRSISLGKTTALAQKKKASRLVVHWDAALAYAARCAGKAKKALSKAVLVCALGKK